MKKKDYSNFLLCGFVILAVINIRSEFFTKKIPRIQIDKKSVLNTSIRGTGHGRKYEVYLKSDTNSIYYLDNFSLKVKSKRYTLGNYIQKGDSIYKKADNDTLILTRGDSISYWVYKKIL